ncbi:MAG: hypothetical protein V4736_10940 [Bdellovibrionota bacterium]
MKNQMLQNIVLSLITLTLFGASASAKPRILTPMHEVHMDLDMTGPEYRQILESQGNRLPDVHPLDDIVEMGARNLRWLEKINSALPVKLSFTSAATQTGTPIETPKQYNEKTIRADFTELMNTIPVEMKPVLLGQAELTATLPIEEAAYLEWGRKANKIYESATRWKLLQPSLFFLAQRRMKDIRGFYFLSRDPAREENFKNYSSLGGVGEEVKVNYKEWLVQVCTNTTGSRERCLSEVAQSISANSLSALYAKYLPGAQKMWDGYFQIPAGIQSSSVTWNATNPQVAKVLIKDPLQENVRQYLEGNIEEEWQWDGWSMQIDFTQVSSLFAKAIEVVWEAGATPHVPGLGVNQIVMDGNSLLTEYNVQWTIRHEVGHVFGLPDCYLEFYDTDAQIMVSYQHDITNLMCSRRGHLQQKHYDEMKKAYYQKSNENLN